MKTILFHCLFLSAICWLVTAQDPCPLGADCSYTNSGADCSLGNTCTFNCPGFFGCEASFMSCGSGLCDFQCTGTFSCRDAIVTTGSGLASFTCSYIYSCLGVVLNTAGGHGDLITMDCDPTRSSCSTIDLNVASGYLNFSCPHCRGGTLSQTGTAAVFTDAPSIRGFLCPKTQWQCPPNPNLVCANSYCECPQFATEAWFCGKCPADTTTGDATWPETDHTTSGVPGTCKTGYYGAPTRDCLFDATWSSTIGATPCQACNCGTGSTSSACDSSGHCDCLPGFTGTKCDTCLSGHFGHSCEPGCPAEIFDHAIYEATAILNTARGICQTGFKSTSTQPLRDCNPGPVWSSKPRSRCLTIKCPEDEENGVLWPLTIARRRAVVDCPGGRNGGVHRWCGVDGTWQDSIEYCR